MENNEEKGKIENNEKNGTFGGGVFITILFGFIGALMIALGNFSETKRGAKVGLVINIIIMIIAFYFTGGFGLYH